MTEQLEYEYDEIGYEAKLQKLLQRSRKNRKASENATYDEIDQLMKENLRIQKGLEDLHNELEVEHFLMEGPRGIDPN